MSMNSVLTLAKLFWIHQCKFISRPRFNSIDRFFSHLKWFIQEERCICEIDCVVHYCKSRKCSWHKLSLICQSKCFHYKSNFHQSVAVNRYIISKMKLLAAIYFHWFASSANINCRWNFLALLHLKLIW